MQQQRAISENIIAVATDWSASARFAGNQKEGNEIRVIKKMCEIMKSKRPSSVTKNFDMKIGKTAFISKQLSLRIVPPSGITVYNLFFVSNLTQIK